MMKEQTLEEQLDNIIDYYLSSPDVQTLMEEVMEAALLYGEEAGMKLLALRFKEMIDDSTV
jgi:hypothetical protein